MKSAILNAILTLSLVSTGLCDQRGSFPFQQGKSIPLQGKLRSTVTFQVQESAFKKGVQELVAQIAVDNPSGPALYWGVKLELLRKDGSPCNPQTRSISLMPEKPVKRGESASQKMTWALGPFQPADVSKVQVIYVESTSELPDNALR